MNYWVCARHFSNQRCEHCHPGLINSAIVIIRHLGTWRNQHLTRHSPRDAKYTSESFRGAQGLRFVWEEPPDTLLWLPPSAYASVKESVNASLSSWSSGRGRQEQISAQRSSLDLATAASALSIILMAKSWGKGEKGRAVSVTRDLHTRCPLLETPQRGL